MLSVKRRLVRCVITLTARVAARAAMALSKLSGDEQCTIFSQLCNVLDPGVLQQRQQ
tara:strand:+ start:169 stop:339 length:171 start_codon:yes stop_codon:yes gene_type:complete